MYQLFMDDSFLGLFFQVLPIALLGGVLYICCRLIRSKTKQLPYRLSEEILNTVFVIYCVGLFNLVLVPANFWLYIWYYLFNGYPGTGIGELFSFSFNLVPTLLRVLTGELTIGSWVIKMLVGNTLMFIPMGILLPLVFPKISCRQMWFSAFLIPLAIELLQGVVGRSFDIDDLLLNMLGIAIGYGICSLFPRKMEAASKNL